MKVETPLSWLSPAPTLQRIESKIGMWASEHGTKQPVWAIKAMTPALSSVKMTMKGTLWINKPVEWMYFCHPCSVQLQWICNVSSCLDVHLKERTDYLEFTLPYKKFKDFLWRWMASKHTFDHLNVVRDKVDVVLHFKKRMPGIAKNEATRT